MSDFYGSPTVLFADCFIAYRHGRRWFYAVATFLREQKLAFKN